MSDEAKYEYYLDCIIDADVVNNNYITTWRHSVQIGNFEENTIEQKLIKAIAIRDLKTERIQTKNTLIKCIKSCLS